MLFVQIEVKQTKNININRSCTMKSNLLLFHRNWFLHFLTRDAKTSNLFLQLQGPKKEKGGKKKEEAFSKSSLVKNFLKWFFFQNLHFVLSMIQFLMIFLFKCRRNTHLHTICISSAVKQCWQNSYLSSLHTKFANTFEIPAALLKHKIAEIL